jgi:hypothetical protein
MTNHSCTVGEIRAFLQSSDQSSQPSLSGLAAVFAAACAEANERLGRCGQYLRQGLRSEALHLSAAEPDLLDAVAVLDFPERARWDELTFAYGLTKAPALAIDVAQALNEAYALEHPLEDLLRSHRRLALARAPLRERLGVIRKIAQYDPSNTIWQDDIVSYEKVRHGEIAGEIQTARSRLDLPALTALRQELGGTEWRTPPPESIIAQAREAEKHVRQRLARDTLANLLGSLKQAQVANDAALARNLRARWVEASSEADLPQGHPLRGQVQTTLDWLDGVERKAAKERKYYKTLDRLDEALAAGPDRATLSEIERDARGFGRDLPPAVEVQLAERYRQLARADRRRVQIRLAVAGATTLVILGLVIGSGIRESRRRELEQAASRISSLLDAKQPREAREAYDRVEAARPGAGGSEELAPVYEQLVAAERKEGDRVVAFRAAVDAVQAVPLAQDIEPAVRAALALALRPDEQAEVNHLARTRRAFLEAQQAKVDQLLAPRIVALQAKVDQAIGPPAGLPPAEDAVERLSALRAEVRSVRDDSAGAGADTRRQIDRLESRLRSASDAIATRLEKGRALGGLVKAIGSIRTPEDLLQFFDRCDEFAKRYPEDSLAKGMLQAAGDRPYLMAAVAWNDLVRSWPRPLTTVPPKDAEERARKLSRYLAENAKVTNRDALARYASFLESLARLGTTDDDNPAGQVRGLFANPLVADVVMVTTKNGKRYYALRPAEFSQAGWKLHALTSVDGKGKTVFIARTNLRTNARSPQSKLADRVRALLAKATASSRDWDTTMLEVLKAIKDAADVDPFLRAMLLQGTIQAAVRGSVLLGDVLADHARLLQEQRFSPRVRWFDPEDDAADADRARARGVLERLPPFEPCGERLEGLRQDLEAAVGRTFFPVGLLVKDERGLWACRTADDRAIRSGLFVPDRGQGWKDISRAGAGAARRTVDQSSADLLVGRLVLVPGPGG